MNFFSILLLYFKVSFKFINFYILGRIFVYFNRGFLGIENKNLLFFFSDFINEVIKILGKRYVINYLFYYFIGEYFC